MSGDSSCLPPASPRYRRISLRQYEATLSTQQGEKGKVVQLADFDRWRVIRCSPHHIQCSQWAYLSSGSTTGAWAMSPSTSSSSGLAQAAVSSSTSRAHDTATSQGDTHAYQPSTPSHMLHWSAGPYRGRRRQPRPRGRGSAASRRAAGTQSPPRPAPPTARSARRGPRPCPRWTA